MAVSQRDRGRGVWLLLIIEGVLFIGSPWSIRFVLADTEHLHQKIAEMGQRIRQLEDALAIFQSGVTSETHPLLRDELLTVKFGPEVQHSGDAAEHSQDTVAECMDALGTLTIGNSGESKYFGRSAGSEVRAFH
jgi:hypothetical protein